MTVTIRYESCDGYYERQTFADLPAAREYAQDWIGKHPELAGWYAVSADGIGKITAVGAELAELFPDQEVLI